MKDKFIQWYYDFFDKQIWDSTLVVAMIGMMIFLAGFLQSGNPAYYKSNILEYRNQNQESIVFIDGKKYKINFEEIK